MDVCCKPSLKLVVYTCGFTWNFKVRERPANNTGVSLKFKCSSASCYSSWLSGALFSASQQVPRERESNSVLLYVCFGCSLYLSEILSLHILLSFSFLILVLCFFFFFFVVFSVFKTQHWLGHFPFYSLCVSKPNILWEAGSTPFLLLLLHVLHTCHALYTFSANVSSPPALLPLLWFLEKRAKNIYVHILVSFLISLKLCAFLDTSATFKMQTLTHWP